MRCAARRAGRRGCGVGSAIGRRVRARVSSSCDCRWTSLSSSNVTVSSNARSQRSARVGGGRQIAARLACVRVLRHVLRLRRGAERRSLPAYHRPVSEVPSGRRSSPLRRSSCLRKRQRQACERVQPASGRSGASRASHVRPASSRAIGHGWVDGTSVTARHFAATPVAPAGAAARSGPGAGDGRGEDGRGDVCGDGLDDDRGDGAASRRARGASASGRIQERMNLSMGRVRSGLGHCRCSARPAVRDPSHGPEDVA